MVLKASWHAMPCPAFGLASQVVNQIVADGNPDFQDPKTDVMCVARRFSRRSSTW